MKRRPTIFVASLLSAAAALAANPPCDRDNNGVLDCADYDAFFADYYGMNSVLADINGNGFATVQDIIEFVHCLNQSPQWQTGVGLGLPTLPPINPPLPPPTTTPNTPPGVNTLSAVIRQNDDFPDVYNNLPIGYQGNITAFPANRAFHFSLCPSTDGPPEPDCFSSVNPQVHRDVWFDVFPPGPGTFTVDTCFPETLVDTRIAIYTYDTSVPAPLGAPVACAGGNALATCAPGRAKVSFPTDGIFGHYIRIGSNGAAVTGFGRLRVSFTPVTLCPPVAAGTATSTYSVAAPGTGTPWTWSVQTPEGAVSGADAGLVTSTAAALALQFVNDINAAGCASVVAAIVPASPADFTITVPGADAPQLFVGPAGLPPSCLVHSPLDPGASAPCTFNPGITRLSSADCNANGHDDTRDILAGVSADLDHDSIPDECACPGDFNDSGDKSPQDLFDFLAAFFAQAPAGDFNRSGSHTPDDIFDFLAAFFSECL